MADSQSALPEVFCWSRFGTEAGEPIGSILERKERERLATGGTFYWGIGNSIGPGVEALLGRCPAPEVLFSPIRSRPRAVDVRPPTVVSWKAAETATGESFRLPPAVHITSRLSQAAARHYALVCGSDDPVAISDHGEISPATLRNLVSGKALGSSQVTAIVERVGDLVERAVYVVALRVRLVEPYFVRLRDATPLAA
jgi:hypothetical protein